jgi:hypothetical protein
MSRIPSIAITTSLIGSGVLAWAFAGRPLLGNPELKSPLNPLGINRSPYGEVFAMAMQGPIDTHFHAGLFGRAGRQHPDGVEPAAGTKEQAASQADRPLAKSKASLPSRWKGMIASLSRVSEVRTNPKAASEALKRHLRREAEDKLRFAYQLDPSHYANYNSLHFFLTEPSIGTRPELTPSAAKLAQDTIDYCLKQDHDPRPALTAAAACTNILHLMFADLQSDPPKYNVGQMRQCLNLLDHCIARYDEIAEQWDESNNWQLLSPQRITECGERLSLISKIRDDAEKTIIRLENESPSHQAAN